MKNTIFDMNGDDLKASIKYVGLLAAGYGIKLSKANSNKIVCYENGDNLNPEDDTYELPSPASENDQRIIRLSSEFYGLDPKNYPDYKIILEIYQGNSLIDNTIEEDKLSGKTQSSLIFVKLIGE